MQKPRQPSNVNYKYLSAFNKTQYKDISSSLHC